MLGVGIKGASVPTPQVNIRVAEEHHGLIRKLAERLRKDPQFGEVLSALLESTTVKPAQRPSRMIAEVRNSDSGNETRLGEIVARLAELEGLQEAVGSLLSRVEALEAVSGPEGAGGPPAASQRPAVKAGGAGAGSGTTRNSRAIPPERLAEADRLNREEGISLPQVLKLKGWSYSETGFCNAVARYRKTAASTGQASEESETMVTDSPGQE
jgi:hypothetical protein